MPYRKAGLDKKLVVPYKDYIETQHPNFKFEGREEELSKLVRTLHLPSNNSIAITGEAGVGRRSILFGLVQKQNDDTMPNELMSRPIFRLNTNKIFSSNGSPEDNMHKALDEMRKIYERRGSRPILVIEDGTNFVNNITGGNNGKVINDLMESDIASNYLDLVINLNDEARRALEQSHPTFMNGFSTLEIEEPGETDILRYMRKHSQCYAGQSVEIPDETLEKILDVSNRYKNIFPFAQPKRAIRLLDEVATDYRMTMHSRPQGAYEREQVLSEIESKMGVLTRGENPTFPESMEVLETQANEAKAWLENAYSEFKIKKGAIRKLQDDMREYDAMIGEVNAKIDNFIREDEEKADKLAEQARSKLIMAADQKDDHARGKSANEFRAMSPENILDFIDYDATLHSNPQIRGLKKEVEKYEEAVRGLSGQIQAKAEELNYSISLPGDYVDEIARKITKTEINPNMFEAMANSEELLNARVLGQEGMIKPIASALRRAATGRNPDDKPLGSFLILGPSGVGKSFVAQQMAELIFGSQKKFLSTIEMQYHKESHTVSTLIGAPPGYAGYGEKGALIKKVQDNPYGVLLLDEIEKAHKDIKQALLGALDTAVIKGMDGQEADLRGNIVIMTSNYGQDLFLDPALSFDEAVEQIRHRIYRDPEHFSPEFLNRTTIIAANFLSNDVIAKIAAKKVNDIEGDIRMKNPDFEIGFEQSCAEAFVKANYSKEQGARIVKEVLEQEIGDEADKLVLSSMRSKQPLSGKLMVNFNGSSFDFDFQPKTPDAENAQQNGPELTPA